MGTRVVMTPSWQAELDGAMARDAINPLSREVWATAVASSPVRTGDMRRHLDHWLARVGRRTVGRIGIRNNSRLATRLAWVEKGTQPHTIEPATRKALFWPTAEHPVRRVRHPGTRPNPFLRRALYRRRAL